MLYTSRCISPSLQTGFQQQFLQVLSTADTHYTSDTQETLKQPFHNNNNKKKKSTECDLI